LLSPRRGPWLSRELEAQLVLAHLFDAMIRSRSRRLAVAATTTCSGVSRMMFFGESAAPSRILPIGLIAVGIVWLALAE
jgi:hypothetical protein